MTRRWYTLPYKTHGLLTSVCMVSGTVVLPVSEWVCPPFTVVNRWVVLLENSYGHSRSCLPEGTGRNQWTLTLRTGRGAWCQNETLYLRTGVYRGRLVGHPQGQWKVWYFITYRRLTLFVEVDFLHVIVRKKRERKKNGQVIYASSSSTL